MSELNPKLYFRLALLALFLPLASGELNIIYNVSRGQVCLDGSNYWSLFKHDLSSDSSAMGGKHDLALNKRDHSAKS